MEKKKIILSIALAVRNEQSNLQMCLESVARFADEIIIVDGGSTDKTVEIAHKFKATVIKTDNPLIFHINKQKALDACHGVWILQLDADEVVTEELMQEILKIIDTKEFTKNKKSSDDRNESSLGSEINGYYIPRKNFFLGHWMRKGGQYPDFVIRLVKRGYANFPCKSVHEQIEIKGSIGYLDNPLLHYSYRTTNEYWKKADLYTTLTAEEFEKNKITNSVGNWLYYSSIKPLSVFLNLYIRHKGFIDGWYGLVFAYWSGLHYKIAWNKYISKKIYLH